MTFMYDYDNEKEFFKYYHNKVLASFKKTKITTNLYYYLMPFFKLFYVIIMPILAYFVKSFANYCLIFLKKKKNYMFTISYVKTVISSSDLLKILIAFIISIAFHMTFLYTYWLIIYIYNLYLEVSESFSKNSFTYSGVSLCIEDLMSLTKKYDYYSFPYENYYVTTTYCNNNTEIFDIFLRDYNYFIYPPFFTFGLDTS
jgi:hypothetical protein